MSNRLTKAELTAIVEDGSATMGMLKSVAERLGAADTNVRVLLIQRIKAEMTTLQDDDRTAVMESDLNASTSTARQDDRRRDEPRRDDQRYDDRRRDQRDDHRDEQRNTSQIESVVQSFLRRVLPENVLVQMKIIADYFREHQGAWEAIQSLVGVYAAHKVFIDNDELAKALSHERDITRQDMIDLVLVVLEVLDTPEKADDVKLREDLKARAKAIATKLNAKPAVPAKTEGSWKLF